MNMQILKRGEEIDRDALLRKLVSIQYTRNDQVLSRGTFRVRGETLEVFPAYAETAFRARMFGDEVERLAHFDPLTGELIADDLEHVAIWPATHYNVKEGTIEAACGGDRTRAQRALRSSSRPRASCSSPTACASARSTTWRCCARSGSARGSRTTRGSSTDAGPATRPYCLIDYFPNDFVCFIDESHQTVPQIGGMHEGDRSRKQTLVDYGFRLPSALDNRPQTFDEFLSITPQIVFVSATPGEYERTRSRSVVEQIVRPTGIVDPVVEVRETRNQIDDLMNEVRVRVEPRRARARDDADEEDEPRTCSQYLLEMGFKTRYLHSEIDTLERIQIIRDLRLGEYDVLVGVNLLREGLDLPEVSLVAILDADKEGFLRGETSLIQTIGRAARNVEGTVLMYADKETQRDACGDLRDRSPARDPARIQRGARHHRGDDRQGISDIAEFLQAESKVPRGANTVRAGARRATESCRSTSSSGWSSSSRRRCSPRPTSCASSTRPSCVTSCASCGATCGRSAPAVGHPATNETPSRDIA